jgi:hypothetical protein
MQDVLTESGTDDRRGYIAAADGRAALGHGPFVDEV